LVHVMVHVFDSTTGESMVTSRQLYLARMAWYLQVE
jgi:hypothetical protein